MSDARTALNLLFSSWGNDTPSLWKIELVSVNLTQGVSEYSVDDDTIMVLDAYIRNGDLDDTESLTDRIIWPVSRTLYASIPNKNLQSPPTSFWLNRQLSPSITLWPIPDFTHSNGAANQLQYYRCAILEDAVVPSGVTLDVPRWWQLATAFGLADLLSLSYAPDRNDKLAARAVLELKNAREQDTENTPMSIIPMVSGYYQR